MFVTSQVLSAAHAFHVKGTVSEFPASKSFSMKPSLKRESMSVSVLESVAYMVSGNAGLDLMSTTFLLRCCGVSLYRAQPLTNQTLRSTIHVRCLYKLNL